MSRGLLRVVVCSFLSFACVVSLVSAQMPDPRQMSGRPLPVSDLSPGTVTARVIRGQLSNPIEGQTVVLLGDGGPKSATTDNAGRATFTGLTPGSNVTVSATVGIERIESQEFTVPSTGGVRLMLVASDSAAGAQAPGGAVAPQAPAAPGTVALGGESRIVVEIGDDALSVFNIMQILNTDARPVQAAPIVFDLPAGAVGVGLLEGSTKSAVAAGTKVTVNGPFAPGITPLQFAYSLPMGRDSIAIEQKLPAALPQIAVIVQKIGAMQLDSAQVTQRREMPANGNTYIVGQGGALRAGDTLSFTLSGLPSRPQWPRVISVSLAVATLAWGAWAAFGAARSAGSRSKRNLQGQGEKLFAELAALEAERRKGSLDPGIYASRRESLVTALEDLYRGLDREVA